jgi:GTPase Era involved in 16S rRNA processing
MAMDANVFQVGVSDHQAKNHFYVRETQNVFLLVFSLLDRQSFLDLDKWTNEIYQHTNATHGSLSIVLIGTKKDACTDQIVTSDEIKKFMRRWEISEYFETSAKTGENVDEAYTSVCEKLLFKRVKRYRNLITKWETGIDDKTCNLM